MIESYMTIELKGLRLFANHGLYAGEAEVGNEFEVDVILQYEAPDYPIESIDETINYAAVYNLVRTTFSIRRELLETCAMIMAGELYKSFPNIIKQTVSIKKLTPLLPNFIGSLGIIYTRLYK